MRVIPPLTITDAILTSSTVSEPSVGETAWVAATAYTVGQQAIRTTTHRIYQRLVAGTTATAPELDTANWLDAGPTNRWAMFDTLRNSATSSGASSSMTIVLTPAKRIDSIALMALVGESVTISITSGGLVVYTTTENLILRNSTTWYKYFFGAFGYQGSAVRFNLPPFTNAIITVTVSRAAGPVSCGAIVIGQSVYVGRVLTQAKSDADNYSTINRDAFGNAVLVPRRAVPKTEQSIYTTNDQVDTLRDLRTALNAVPAVWSGMDDNVNNPCFEALLLLGIYKSFPITMNNDGTTSVSLSLEEI